MSTMSVVETASRLVLIDDSPIMLDVVGRALERMGWTVYRALGGKAGIERIEGLSPDVVVCDLHMPDVGGLEVIEHVRANRPGVPVIVLSGDAELDAVLSAIRHGAFDYVVKADEDLRPLGEAVRRAFEHRRLIRQNERLQADLDHARDRLAVQLQELNRQHDLLQKEQAKSEHLLLNILPKRIAERLKTEGEGRLIADRIDNATVLFADIVGFTPMSATLEPNELVARLNGLFSRFDQLAEALGVEKIKTLGDAYMAAAGVPEETPDHAEVAGLMALRMLDDLRRYNEEIGFELRLRIGLHSGPLVAGVIGKNKFIYDLWGDTVNIASRMESHGRPGTIQITQTTQDLVKHRFHCEPIGEIDVKGKGLMPVYRLSGLA
jgi:class 3 adenylate cyclase/ActR/RegA family two-component response regulator